MKNRQHLQVSFLIPRSSEITGNTTGSFFLAFVTDYQQDVCLGSYTDLKIKFRCLLMSYSDLFYAQPHKDSPKIITSIMLNDKVSWNN